jgi:hypothetical protein
MTKSFIRLSWPYFCFLVNHFLFFFQNGLNALHLAAKEGHVGVVKELLSRGAKIDAPLENFCALGMAWIFHNPVVGGHVPGLSPEQCDFPAHGGGRDSW